MLAEGVLAQQADTEEQLTGPSWKVAFKDGAPTPAAEAFAKKAGVAVADLEKSRPTPKGEYVGATVKRPGRAAAEILAAELPKEVLAIYWAKNMYWRAGKPERFVRPVRWVVALLDSEIVPLEIAGIAAGNASRGHRVLHGERPSSSASAQNYAEALRAAFVDRRRRRAPADHPQSPRRRHAHRPRRALARGRAAGRNRHPPHRVAHRDPRRL